MEIDDLLPEKPLSTLFFHGIFWKSKTSNTVDFPKAFPENLAWRATWQGLGLVWDWDWKSELMDRTETRVSK